MRFHTRILGLGVVCCAAAAVGYAQTQPPAAAPPTAHGAQPNQPTDPRAAGPRFDAARFIRDHDLNHDGKLSKDELPAGARDEFALIDANKDGFITQDELQQYTDHAARQRPQLVEVVLMTVDVPEEPLNTQELQAAYDQLRQIDKNHDGKIDDGELKTFREQRRKDHVDHLISAFDRNKDGKISKDEARGLWADNFAQLDTNKDGVLDRQEVEAALSASRGQGTQAPGTAGVPAGQPKR